MSVPSNKVHVVVVFTKYVVKVVLSRRLSGESQISFVCFFLGLTSRTCVLVSDAETNSVYCKQQTSYPS